MAILLDGTNGITTSGNNTLGDASTDTLNVGNGGLVKDASGFVGIGTASPLNPVQTYKLGDYSSSSNNIRNFAYFQADATVANSSIIFNTNPTAGQNLRGFRFAYQSADFSIARFHTDKTSGAQLDLNINTNGNIALLGGATNASGVGITFPITQVASSDANCLDDYEEGSWTPSYALSAGSVSSVTSSGNYVKIGKQVTVNFYITFGTATGATLNTITGLPFTVANTTAYSVGASRENANTGYMWELRPSAADTVMLIRRYDNSDSIASGFTFYGTATYFVS